MTSWLGMKLLNANLSTLSGVLRTYLDQYTPDKKGLVYAQLQLFLLSVPWRSSDELNWPSRFTQEQLFPLFTIISDYRYNARRMEKAAKKSVKKIDKSFFDESEIKEQCGTADDLIETAHALRLAVEILECTVGCGINQHIVTNTEALWSMQKLCMPEVAKAITALKQRRDFLSRMDPLTVNPIDPLDLEIDELILQCNFVPEQFS